jgi:hypothetical protein
VVWAGALAVGFAGAAGAQPERSQQEDAPARPQTDTERTAALLDESRLPPARIDFQNAMGRSFRLVEIQVFMDGRKLLQRTAREGGELPQRFSIYDGPIQRGAHDVVAYLVFRGRNRGPFTYLDGYTVKVESRQSFVARPDQASNFTLVADEIDDPTAPLMSRPVVVVRSEVEPAAPQLQFVDPRAQVRVPDGQDARR